eukprot:TRINITY_DN12045_c0_g1_i1.p1 TRINITY_DN12045_c0_g1~~TRINITY_DN12045_c0_g1_i1.p1  ORF type:complete len:383 (+),score=80.30 TRINITY_DN12045_c0_g1_i1:63-1211(+)
MCIRDRETAVIEKITSLFHSQFEFEDVIDLLQAFVRQVSQIVNCGYCRILIVEEKLKKYLKSKTKMFDTLFVGREEALVIIDKMQALESADIIMNLNDISSFKEIKRAFIKQDVLTAPIFDVDNSTLVGVVQCADPKMLKHGGKKNSFRFRDEVVLAHLCSLCSSSINWISQSKKLEKSQARFDSFVDMIIKIVENSSFQILSINFKEALPKFFGFSAGGLLFFNKRMNFLYSLEPTIFADGTIATGNVLRYPTNVGLSGRVFTKGTTIVENEPSKNVSYNPEIDNMSGVAVVHNIIIAPLKTTEGNIVGVMQIANKRDGKSIDEEDSKKFSRVTTLFGNIIKHIDVVTECLDLSAALKTSVLKLEHDISCLLYTSPSPRDS